MSLRDLTRDAVLAAVREFDELGRAAFLEKYGFRPAARFVLAIGCRRYPSKAIVGAALGLRAGAFSGGLATVGRVLRKLGFAVKKRLKWLVDACLSPIYLSVPPTKSEAHWKAVHDRAIAVITTPNVGSARIPEWPIWAADNGCFTAGSSFDLPDFLAWLTRWRDHAARCLFATAPDVVCDAAATWARSAPVLPQIRERGYPAALVAQNGIEHMVIEWDAFDALFIGGDDAFKLGRISAELVAEANRRDKWTHCGRVNGGGRRWYERLNEQPSLFLLS